MALTIANQPVVLSSANDDLVYTCLESSLYTQTNFKYICDIYVGGVRVAQLKAFPNPVSHYGVFNIGNVVRNYVNSNLTYLLTSGIRVDKFTKHTIFVQCNFGYEYGATIVQYLNIQTRTNYFSNTYNKRRTLTTLSNPIMSTKKDNFATNRPTKTSIYLTTTSNSPVLIPFYSGVVYPSSPQNLVVRTRIVKIDGTIVSAPNITSVNSATDYTMIEFNVSPQSLNSIWGTTYIDDSCLYYYNIIAIQDALGYFDVTGPSFYPYCESKYEVFTLVWLNQYGGYDSYQFSKKSKRTYNSDKKSFERVPYMIDSSNGLMSYVQRSGSSTSNVMVESSIVYDSKFKETMSFNTDIIDELTYDWLSELIISPSVFVYLDSAFVPLSIKETNYEFKKRVNDKVFNLTINAELQQQMNAQYR